MSKARTSRRQFMGIASGLIAAGWTAHAEAQPPGYPATKPQWANPVHRVANAMSATKPAPVPVVPPGKAALLRGLEMARQSLEQSQNEVRDYTAILVKRERVDGTAVGEHEYMSLKVRNRKVSGGQLIQPFSVYIAFLKPSSVKGREVIYVENRNDGKLIAHEGGFK